MEQYHVVSFSGGKDSTAMLLRMLELNMQVDEIIFCDTSVEFPQMYEHVEKVKNYIGREITYLRPEHDYEYMLLKYRIHARDGSVKTGKSFPSMQIRWCTSYFKRDIIRKHLTGKDYVQYIGIAADEMKRVRNERYPLVEWGWTEADCLRYCKEKGFDWGGLYDIFHRVSCWCCPLQPMDELRNLRHNFPALWAKLREWESKTWNDFRPDYSVEELETRFALEDEWFAEGRDWRKDKQGFMKEYRLRNRGWEQVKLFR